MVLLALTNFSWMVERTVFFLVFILASLGYGILHLELNHEKKKKAFSLLTCFTFAVAGNSFYGGFFLFTLVIMYVLLIRYCIVLVYENIRDIADQIRLLRGIRNFDENATPGKLVVVIGCEVHAC